MRFPSRATPTFWRRYRALPVSVRAAARKTYQLWQVDALHPSLHFKRVAGDKWSVRIGIHYRAVGKFDENGFVWDWIGTHGEYDRIV